MSKKHRSRWLKKLLFRRAFVALLLLAQIAFIGLNILRFIRNCGGF